MNEQDLRDCFAMFAMMSYWKDPEVAPDFSTAAAWSYDMADAMLEARKPQETVGLPAIKKRARK
jgi:hypothetical protein